mgnify:CR=1 FL=1
MIQIEALLRLHVGFGMASALRERPGTSATQLVRSRIDAERLLVELRRLLELPLAAQVFPEYGSTLVDIDGDTLTATMVNARARKNTPVMPSRKASGMPRCLAISTPPPN